MSSVPPVTPSGDAPPPFPPYNSKTQWRAYRAQRKAAWKAQRDAWKAQQHAWNASAAGAYGPQVPSLVGPFLLIGIGVVALLLLTGRVNAGVFWGWYGHWWPLLLIGAGLAMLAEWAIDFFRPSPVRRGGGFVSLLVLLGILGVLAAGWTHMKPWYAQMRNPNQWGMNRDFSSVFGLPEHDFDRPALHLRSPANADIDIENPRGDVRIVAGNDSTIQVQAHEVAYANSDADAQKIFDAVAAHVTVDGSAVKVVTAGNANGRVDLVVTVPRSDAETVNVGQGSVTATGLDRGIRVTAHGDIRLDSISGPVQARLFDGKHDISAQNIRGGLNIDGDVNNITLSEVQGKVMQNGNILGDVQMENIRGPVRLHTSVTSLELVRLPGDLSLDSDNLHVNEADGPVRVTTYSKDVDLSQIYGDSFVEDRDGDISVEPAGAYSVEAKNSRGGVEVTLPPNASATVNARTHNGDILSDYPIPPVAGADKAVVFQIGSGASRIVLSADNGDVRIKKGPAFPSETPITWTEQPGSTKKPMLNVPLYHRVPSLAGAPHLKAAKPLPPEPVSQ